MVCQMEGERGTAAGNQAFALGVEEYPFWKVWAWQ